MTTALPSRLLDRSRAALLVIDVQARLMPAIANGAEVIANTRRLLDGAALLDVPALFTEQVPDRLGATVSDLGPTEGRLVTKASFDACRAADFLPRLSKDATLVVAGCEAHVCVLQTVLGLLAEGRRVAVVADAVGSRTAENRAAALARMAAAGAEIVTLEMALFEWLEDAHHPRFRDVMKLIK